MLTPSKFETAPTKEAATSTKVTEVSKDAETDRSIGTVNDYIQSTTGLSVGTLAEYYGEDLYFEGTPEDDDYAGRHGDDIMRGSDGADRFDGSYGVDTADYSNSPESVVINLRLGTLEPDPRADYAPVNNAQSGGYAEGDILINVENVIGTQFDDRFSGNESDNRFEGGDGNDTFRLDGGSDTYLGGGDFDTLIVDGTGATINLMTGTGSGGVAEGDHYDSIEAVVLDGADNTVIGSNSADTVTVNRWGSTLEMNGGADTINYDIITEYHASIDGGSGIDTIDFSGSGDSLGININLHDGTFAFIGGGVIGIPTGDGPGLIENVENVVGTSSDDVIWDDKNVNTFTGGDGQDVFVFHHTGYGEIDRITDFEAGVDRIDLTDVKINELLLSVPNPYSMLGLPSNNPTVDTMLDFLYLARDLNLDGGKFDGLAFLEQDGDDVIVHTDFGRGNAVRLDDVQVTDLGNFDFIL
ncbi:MAG: M10 family metallopeptidase C-terminal domain-containing protein [Hyphomicrobiaceae bacterium]|nr:M10 family metallopeptidase C-terminal domain-containing protein [Hyphomicrobiaceae bacterium]